MRREGGRGYRERSVGKINTVCGPTGRDNQSCLTLITQHRVCVLYVCARMCVCVCMRACVHVCACAHTTFLNIFAHINL